MLVVYLYSNSAIVYAVCPASLPARINTKPHPQTPIFAKVKVRLVLMLALTKKRDASLEPLIVLSEWFENLLSNSTITLLPNKYSLLHGFIL